MSALTRSLAITFVAVLAGCAATTERSLAERDTTIFLDGDSLHTGTGATTNTGAGGTVSGSSTAPKEKKDQRANTPPGKDREGSNPAAGAIVDPAGVTSTPPPRSSR